MKGVINGAYYCQFERAAKINNGIYDRNVPSGPLNMSYNPRSTPTRYVKMPILDCRMPTKVPCKNEIIYNPYKTFNPGTSAPFSGFSSDIDQESRLQNRFFPLQKSAQAKFIPNSNSDLYKVEVVGRRVNMTHPLLFKKEQLAPQDVNKCHLGRKLFNNFTRLQVRNLPVGGGVGK